MSNGWRWFWRGVGLVALLLSVASCFFLYSLWKVAQISPVAQGKRLENGLDVVSLQIDILSITMAAVGIGLGAIGLFGYQSLKDAAEGRAERVARDVASKRADEVATKAVAKHIENMRDEMTGLRGANQQATIDPGSIKVVDGSEVEHGRDS